MTLGRLFAILIIFLWCVPGVVFFLLDGCSLTEPKPTLYYHAAEPWTTDTDGWERIPEICIPTGLEPPESFCYLKDGVEQWCMYPEPTLNLGMGESTKEWIPEELHR